MYVKYWVLGAELAYGAPRAFIVSASNWEEQTNNINIILTSYIESTKNKGMFLF